MRHSAGSLCHALSSFVLCGVCTATALGDISVIYDASNGLLPSELCWNDFVFQNPGPEPVIEGDSLRVGPTDYGGTRGYLHAESAFVFDDGVAVEARVRILNSTYGAPSGFERAGYSLYIADNLERWGSLELGEGVILLRTSSNLGVTAAFDTTGAFNDYRMEFDGSTVRAIVNGSELLSLPLGTGAGEQNRLYFGDLTILGNSESLTESVVLTIGEVEPCPPDINRDGAVDLEDLDLVLTSFGNPVCVEATGDGFMDLEDLDAVLTAFGSDCPTGG